MSLFKKFFGNSGNEDDNDKKTDVRSPYSPETTMPIDDQFTFNFKENGGKFIYCEIFKLYSKIPFMLHN